MACWEQCWAFVSAAFEESLHWNHFHATEYSSLLSEEYRCWSMPSGSGLPDNTSTCISLRQCKYPGVYSRYICFFVVTWRILSWTAGVRGVCSPVTVLVTLYSDRRAEDAELPLSLSSAAWRATSLARPNLTTSSSSASLIYEEQMKALQCLFYQADLTKVFGINWTPSADGFAYLWCW